MAFNPLLCSNSVPSLIEGDRPILQVKQVGCEIILDNRSKRYIKLGYLYLSAFRLVFVVVPPDSSSFQVFDIPLAHVSNEKVYGTEVLEGRVAPLYNYMPCPAVFRF